MSCPVIITSQEELKGGTIYKHQDLMGFWVYNAAVIVAAGSSSSSPTEGTLIL